MNFLEQHNFLSQMYMYHYLNMRIRNLREDKDLTQEDIAKYLSVSQRTYSRYENGERSIPAETLSSIV